MADSRAAFKELVVLAKGAEKVRDQVMILCGGVLGLSVTDLRGLTVGQAREQFDLRGANPYVARVSKLVEDYIKKLPRQEAEDYLFRSERHLGRLERTVVWRIINGAIVAREGKKASGGIRVLQRLYREISVG